MKKICFAIACVALLGSLAAPAIAQQLAKADVPFSFSVHDKVFPAGAYELQYLGDSLVRLQDVRSKVGVTLIAPSAIRESTGMKWTFRQYGDQRFLASLSDPILGYEAGVPKSDSERKLMNSRKATTVIVRAAR